MKKSIQEQVDYMKNYIGRKRLKGMLDKLTQEKNNEIKVLGEGAYSVVFGYKDVAIKFYKDKANMSKLYTINNQRVSSNTDLEPEKNDAEILKDLCGIDAIPELYYSNKRYIIVERITGKTIQEKIYNNEKIDKNKYNNLCEKLDNVLVKISKAGYSVEDIHGGNIMITDNGELNIVDVGLFFRSNRKVINLYNVNVRKTEDVRSEIRELISK